MNMYMNMNKCMLLVVFQFESVDTEQNVFYLGDGEVQVENPASNEDHRRFYTILIPTQTEMIIST